jgi:hypothetical protein
MKIYIISSELVNNRMYFIIFVTMNSILINVLTNSTVQKIFYDRVYDKVKGESKNLQIWVARKARIA